MLNGVIDMKLFIGNDYTFCLGDNCDKKESCMRWIEHYDKVDEFDCRTYVKSCSGNLFVDGTL